MHTITLTQEETDCIRDALNIINDMLNCLPAHGEPTHTQLVPFMHDARQVEAVEVY